MIAITVVFAVVFGALAAVHAFMAVWGGPQKIVANMLSLLIALFLTGWLILLLILDLPVTGTLFTLCVSLFAVGTMYQALVTLTHPQPAAVAIGTVMAVAGFFFASVASTQEFSLFAMLATFFTLVGAVLFVSLFGHMNGLTGMIAPVPSVLGGSSIAVGVYLTLVRPEYDVLISLLILGGLVAVQGITGIIAGWNCEATSMMNATLYEMLFYGQKRPTAHHGKNAGALYRY